MPLDSRRLPVPEDSQPPEAYSTKGGKPELIDHNGCRHDGRRPEQSRPLFMKCGIISQAKGSAYIEMNNTKCICAVYGPREVTKREEFSMQGQLLCEVKYATFSCALRRKHQQDQEEKDASLMLKQALTPAVRLDKFPKARMDVYVTVLENDGSALAAALSAASVALADAGVEMYDLVVGCSLRLFGETVLVDPTAAEQYDLVDVDQVENAGEVMVGFMPSLHQVSALSQRGQLHPETATQGVRTCVENCQHLYPVLQQCLLKSVKSRLEIPAT